MRKHHRHAGKAWLLAILLLLAALAAAQTPGEALLGHYQSLTAQLEHNQFGQPLVLASTQTDKELKGEIYAVVDHPFAQFKAGVSDPGNWCDILILHLNIKYCHQGARPDQLVVFIGRKFDQPLSDAHELDFAWRAQAGDDGYSQINLVAGNGPLGTHDYRINLESAPLDAGHTFVHLSYAYGYGLTARLALQTYLNTLGSDKVGFTTVDGAPVGGIRGLVERNTIRYYFAIESWLSAPQPEARMRNWFTATERYPRQLHEMDADEYMAMKRSEYRRQQKPPNSQASA
ncbi:hypothetical protein [Silvimonas iriomotensis]|uniref:Uncharacterized protein n=1 Tax=Silvimonas iriomotensis TaxID=449662 RepID=A0ABQ2PCK2_9NEIS|nr:hypothetical protein [Silvimonas iriomotensis]GGP23225.1 hypothetical protein GCM10010970_32250 [Silvimonas iriomotensis]